MAKKTNYAEQANELIRAADSGEDKNNSNYNKKKQKVSFDLTADVYNDFKALCAAWGKTMAQALKGFCEESVENNAETITLMNKVMDKAKAEKLK